MIVRFPFALVCLLAGALPVSTGTAQTVQSPPGVDLRMYEIIEAVSADRLEADIRALAGFGTRNTFSDTTSSTRGIGAARRWIKAEFDVISEDCGGCLEVYYQRSLVEEGASSRAVRDVWVVNVVALQRGTRRLDTHPERYVIMSGDIDSRASSSTDAETDAPGANDNASGMAGTVEAARVLSKYSFPTTIVYAGLSGEEQGLWGGQHMAAVADSTGWDIVGVLNNDMIGNIEGVDGVIDNRSFRIFSEPTPVTETEQERRRRRFTGGEVDGVSWQLARYVHDMTRTYMPEMNPMLIYRLDRFGRGGHHRPFNDAGFPGIRIMEAHENYTRQHQDIRVEDGIEYGDVIEGVNFEYARRLTAVNAISLAGMAWAPPAPPEVRIGGAVQPSTRLEWDPVDDPNLAGYRVYWRDTTSPTWDHSRFVPSQRSGAPGENLEQDTEHDATGLTLRGLVIDNYLFGVASVGRNGNESPVVFPSGSIR